MSEKILLHICCAPCLIYPLRSLKEQGFHVEGLFYNPNIHPDAEYARRSGALKAYAASVGLTVDYPRYEAAEFFASVDTAGQKRARCADCWALRLRAAAQEAARRGYRYFSTTLLVSPYQDHDILLSTGRGIARETGVMFHAEDFRPGFRSAQAQARAHGMYRQKYCGCVFSESERQAVAAAA